MAIKNLGHLIDLQTNVDLKFQFKINEKIDFYKNYITEKKFPNIHKLLLQIAAAMGTTYMCETFFSKFKIVKTRFRYKISDVNLKNQLRCLSSSLPINFKKLSNQIQKQISH